MVSHGRPHDFVDQCYSSCSLLLCKQKMSSIAKLIVIKWMPDLIFKKKWFKKTWNQYNCIKLIYIWNQIVYLVCNLSKLNRHWPLGCRQTEISCIGLFDTNLRHWTHDTQIHRTTECPAKLSMFYFAQQIIYKSIDFIFLCMLVVYEWVCKYVSEINDWNCT